MTSDSVVLSSYLQDVPSIHASCPRFHKMLDSELSSAVIPLPHGMPSGDTRLPLSLRLLDYFQILLLQMETESRLLIVMNKQLHEPHKQN